MMDRKNWKVCLWLRLENRIGWNLGKKNKSLVRHSICCSIRYLKCNNDPGEADSYTCSTENETHVEIGYSEESTKKNRKRSQEPSQESGTSLHKNNIVF